MSVNINTSNAGQIFQTPATNMTVDAGWLTHVRGLYANDSCDKIGRFGVFVLALFHKQLCDPQCVLESTIHSVCLQISASPGGIFRHIQPSSIAVASAYDSAP
jgi:hypothetical protein